MTIEPTRPQASDYALATVPVFLGALALYMATLLPDVGVWDTAEFQTLGPVLGIAHPTGYPTYTLLLWLASVVLQPFGNEAYRADLLSATLVAGAAAPTALPAVHPFTVFIVLVGDEHGVRRLDQALLGGEELVTRMRDSRAKPRLFEAYPFPERVFRVGHQFAPRAISRMRAILCISSRAFSNSSS